MSQAIFSQWHAVAYNNLGIIHILCGHRLLCGNQCIYYSTDFVKPMTINKGIRGLFKKIYVLVNPGALKSSLFNKLHIFQCIGKIFPINLARTLGGAIFIQCWNTHTNTHTHTPITYVLHGTLYIESYDYMKTSWRWNTLHLASFVRRTTGHRYQPEQAVQTAESPAIRHIMTLIQHPCIVQGPIQMHLITSRLFC